MRDIKVLGIDIAKEVFQLHGVDTAGEVKLKKKLSRNQLVEYVSTHVQQGARIVMEACGGSHHWARLSAGLGFQTQLVSPQFVKPFVKTNKTDAHDAEAITIAAQQLSMRYVSVKQVEQQDTQNIHRIRERLIGNRTALVNQIRGLLQEYGVVIPRSVPKLRERLPEVIQDTTNELSVCAREEFEMLREELDKLDKRIDHYDKKIVTIFKNSELCQRLGKIEGIGPITATMLSVHLSDPSVFKNGRHFAAFLGLVPKQHSSGGRHCLLGISKRGDRYLRGLLVHGGRAVVKGVGRKSDPRSLWATALKQALLHTFLFKKKCSHKASALCFHHAIRQAECIDFVENRAPYHQICHLVFKTP